MPKTRSLPFTCRRDDLTIRGHLYGDPSSRKSAVILSHGFLANQSTVVPYAELIAQMGLLAFTFDFCGGGLGGRSDGRTVDMSVLTEKQDLKAVFQAVTAHPNVTDVSLLGCSQGGFVSAMVAKDLGATQVRSLMLFYPALCIPDDARKGSMMAYQFDPRNLPKVLGRFPMKLGAVYAQDVLTMDPYEEIRGYDGPTLLLHGTADRIVNISYARQAKDCYPNLTYHEIEGGEHAFRKQHDVQAREYLHAFLQSLA